MFSFFANRYGRLVAEHPLKTVLLSLLACGLCAIGLINYTEENNAFKLWIPTNSDFYKNNIWLEENFPPDNRLNNVILDGTDLLQPEILREVKLAKLAFLDKNLRF